MPKVMLIDDSVVIRKMLKRVLSECGISDVVEAGDGSAALKLLEAGMVDLMLCDVNMPVMDGLQFLENVHAHPEFNKIPVVMVTTEGAQENVLKAVQLGAKGYIRKPFTPDEVKQKLAECLKPVAA